MRMVVDARVLAARRCRRRPTVLVSNIGIVPPAGVPFVRLPQDGFVDAFCEAVIEADARNLGMVVAIDEVNDVLAAQNWAKVSDSVRAAFTQSRHYGVDVFWTAQFVDQVEKGVRNVTEEIELVRAFPTPTIEKFERGDRPLLIIGQRYRPGAVRELLASPPPERRMGRAIHLYRREHESWYDTRAILRGRGGVVTDWLAEAAASFVDPSTSR